MPDHTALSRRAATLEVPRPGNAGAGAGGEPMHLLVDSTGLKLCGKGEWLLEKRDGDTPGVAHAAPGRGRRHRPDRGLHADPQGGGRRVASRSLERHPEAVVVVPPRTNAVPSDTAESAPTQRDGHLQHIARHGRMSWQTASGYNRRARVEAAMNRWKQVIGDGLRAHADERRATEVAVAVHALNRMLDLGRPSYVRIA